jgi:hypothetical protein
MTSRRAITQGLARSRRRASDPRVTKASQSSKAALKDSENDSAAAAAAILARLPEGEGDRLRTQLTGLTGVLELRAAIRRDFRPETTTGGTSIP